MGLTKASPNKRDKKKAKEAAASNDGFGDLMTLHFGHQGDDSIMMGDDEAIYRRELMSLVR